MNVRAKFDGGKQINRCQSGSWQARCAGAALRLNEGPSWGSEMWSKVVSTPSTTFRAVGECKTKKLNEDRKRLSTDGAKGKRKKAKKESQSASQQGREHYSRYDGGSNANDILKDITDQHLCQIMREYYLANINITESARENLTLMTSGQGNNEHSFRVWQSERRKRITASNVGKIAKRRDTTKVRPLVKELMYTKFEGSTATRWGLLQEESTNTQYLKEKQYTSPDLSTSQSGLIISPDNPWLAASPDGLVYDPTETSPYGIVEYKNPYSVRNKTLHEAATTKKGFCLTLDKTTNVLALNRKHDYFYQVQCIMYCSQRQWCDIVIRAVDLHIERIHYDPDFWIDTVLPKLKSFYFKAVLPELASPLGPTLIREPTDTFKKECELTFP